MYACKTIAQLLVTL